MPVWPWVMPFRYFEPSGAKQRVCFLQLSPGRHYQDPFLATLDSRQKRHPTRMLI